MGKYKVIDGKGVIPEGTTYIDEYSFFNNKELKRIRIPESVREIGDDAFKGCSNLLHVHIPNNTCLREIGYHAFEGTAIFDLYIPEGVEVIKANTFYNCKELESIHLPKSLKKIESLAFYGCSKLEEIEMPNNVEIEEGAFLKCRKWNYRRNVWIEFG